MKLTIIVQIELDKTPTKPEALHIAQAIDTAIARGYDEGVITPDESDITITKITVSLPNN